VGFATVVEPKYGKVPADSGDAILTRREQKVVK
jgi:hypothetical protein